jgi:hypothetical protein
MRKGGNNSQATPIEFKGVIYPCISDAIRATGFSMMQIRYRLSKGDDAKYLPQEKIPIGEKPIQ